MENTDIKVFDIEELGTWPIALKDMSVSEGDLKLSQHLKRERNRKIVEYAKEQFKSKHNGKIFCEICGFDFNEQYGELGKDFIEAHHIRPVAEMKKGDITKVEDFKMVCSNCHSMLHRRKCTISHLDIKLKWG